MRTPTITSLAVAVLLLAACGGGSSGAQDEVVDLLIESASDEGLEVDRGCVEEIANKFSDEDAEKMIAAGGDADVDLSPEGEAASLELFSCLDTDSYVDSFIEELGGDENVDADCIKDALEGLDPAALAEEELFGNIFECIDLGG